MAEIGNPGRACSLLIVRQKTPKSLYYATEQATCKNVVKPLALKSGNFPFCSKKSGERNADKAPLSGTVRHEMHLQFLITLRYVCYHCKTSLANCFHSINRTCLTFVKFK